MNIAYIPFFPLIGFLINGLWYLLFQSKEGKKKAGAVPTGVIASLAIFSSFVVSLIAFFQLSGNPDLERRVIEETIFSWISVGDFHIDFALRMDSLSVLFAMVISGVGSLIHVYSIGYMSEDATPGKFFAFLNLFCFAMLILVLGASLPVTFLGWEGVGLCSYLLIGYWYEDMEKASAGKKAFIVNRIGDFGFILGIFLIFTTFGTMDYEVLKGVVLQNGAAQAGVCTVIGLLLFLGCTGKSAQIPLYIWLPDAMAGPTPVSALIHAATMVTSGIYVLARLNFIYMLSPTAMAVVAWVGACTAFFAATMAIAQTDIKKVLAYSTVSQLGYMFLACGVGGFTAGVFHVITHAFFKALLFLGAGSVIFGMHHEQNILKMGGLRSKMPRTFMVMLIATAAICGIPGFSGFFSKDEILWLSFHSEHGHPALWAIGAITAMMTAFYMMRMFTLTFLTPPAPATKEHSADHGHHHGDPNQAHESPWVMVGPLVVLAVLSALGGFIGIPHMSWIEHWLEPVIPVHESHFQALELVLMFVSVLGAAASIFAAYQIYKKPGASQRLQARFPLFHKISYNKWYVDEVYELLIINPIANLSRGLWKSFDAAVIDRLVLSVGRVSLWSGQSLRVMQTGSLQVYAGMIFIGLILTLGYLVYGIL